MSTGRAPVALVAALVAGCGASSSPGPTTPGGPDAAGATSAASEAAASEAWAQLDPERAAREAERALRLDPGAADAAEIAARAHLALGHWDRAIRATEGATDPALLRLRAGAQIAAGAFSDAAETLEVARHHAREEDPWTESVGPAVAALGEAPYEVRGEGATLPLEDLPLPVVRVQVDAVSTLALVGTGAFLAVLDPRVRRSPGAIDELGLGDLRVREVPHTVRALDAVSEALGVEIGMVLGADLLLRLSATLDGPGRQLVLHASPPARPDTASARLLSLSGSFLAIEAERGGQPVWLTLDTAGLFPVAVGPGGAEALGLADAAWQEDGPLGLTLADLRLGTLAAEGVPVVRGLLDEAHARAVGAPVAGAVGWTLLSELTVSFDARARRLRFESASGAPPGAPRPTP